MLRTNVPPMSFCCAPKTCSTRTRNRERLLLPAFSWLASDLLQAAAERFPRNDGIDLRQGIVLGVQSGVAILDIEKAHLSHVQLLQHDWLTWFSDSKPSRKMCIIRDALYADVASGAKAARPGLAEALDYLRAGDTLVVWRLDRLGRSLSHLIEVVRALDFEL